MSEHIDPFDQPFSDTTEDTHSPSSYMPPEPPCSPVYMENEMNGNPSASGSLSPMQPDPPKTNSAAFEALQKQIQNRTQAIDRENAEKEKAILDEAKKYLESQKAQHEKEVATAREEHRKSQKNRSAQLKEHSNPDTLWRNIGMMVDLSKPNKHSRNTERMRTVFQTMNQKTSANLP